MSRRSAPDSPWQNGMPPFGLCQQQFSPMMNCGPVWAQHNLPFMGGSMAPDMMRFGGNVSSRSNFRRNYDQPDRYRPRQGFNDRYGNRQGAYNRGDRKRPGPSDRSRSPAPKRGAQGRDGSRKADQDRPKKAGASEEGPAEDEDTTGTQNDDLYDPAEPTTEDIADGAEKAEGQEEDDSGEGVEEEGAKDGDEDDQEAGGSESKDESGGTEAHADAEEGGGEDGAQPTGKPTAKSGAKVPAKPGAKASGSKASDPKSPTKGADGKGQTGGRAADKARQEGMRKGGQKDKGWCTVCEVHFDGSFLDHRRTEEHKVKRDEKYPKCHPCSMGFNNRKQYEQHCSGDFHRKNVEILDNEVDETAGPLGEEYLEEIPAYFCTLCKLLLKIELKSHHCCTQGHYRRHRDIKRKEEAALKAKLAKEKAEDEEDDTNQVAYTITDEVGSDDEARAASDATASKANRKGAAEGTKGSKQDKTAEETLEALPVKEASGTTKEQPEAEQDGEQPVAQVKSEPAEAEGGQDALEEDCKEEKEALENEAASLMDEPKEDNVPDTNGCKSLEEDMEEQKPAVAAAESSADPPATNADPAPTKAAAPKAPAAKVPAKNVPASKAAATAPKPAATATRAPAAKTGTAAGSAAATSAPAASATAAPAPAKKPPTAAGSAAAAGGGRGGMVRGRGRGAPKAVRARKR
ncbi:uncharacterized protein [Dermacentor andersoni]|uniref:uncharacterized protein isoform X1 n=1 Tax=Dermacentor andersoni TaxID=34620 RepID=UPI0021556DC4|nr:uncharacterized protein LOC126547612 isoform X1 [Dermacentor andersoni]XP_050051463.1 uncharacterized protein LOC126547612 isoform X1 [Dermacentor andersoni]XP_050051464.1 uncharacterized protein LOC126547612 isoform X1 [Dermacentor andersoni]